MRNSQHRENVSKAIAYVSHCRRAGAPHYSPFGSRGMEGLGCKGQINFGTPLPGPNETRCCCLAAKEVNDPPV